MIVYLDESGDLGWKFDAPYRKGGSSRHLTIASLLISRSKIHLPKRLIRDLYTKYKWSTGAEKKWAEMKPVARDWFAQSAAELQRRYPADVRYLSITVKKVNVQDHIRTDPNKLYNYMIGLSLLDEMSKHQSVLFVPDPRSVKVESGNSLHDYLQTELWFKNKAETKLKTAPCNSAADLNVQFSDMLSGVVQGHFEDGNSNPWRQLRENIISKTLFF